MNRIKALKKDPGSILLIAYSLVITLFLLLGIFLQV